MSDNAALAAGHSIVALGRHVPTAKEDDFVPFLVGSDTEASAPTLRHLEIDSTNTVTEELLDFESSDSVITGKPPILDLLVDSGLLIVTGTIVPSNVVPADVQWHLLSERVAALADLTDDWNSYGAPPPNQEALASARAVLESAREKALLPNEIVPSVEGGVVITFHIADRHADIEVFNDGSVLAMTSEPPHEPYVWPIRSESNDIQEALENIRAFVGR